MNQEDAMAVNAEDIENPERGLELTTRRRAGPKHAPAAVQPQDDSAELLEMYERRFAAVKAMTPKDDPAPHCRDCYRRGWSAALRMLEE